MTRSVTMWNRLEPRSVGLDPGPGPALEARVYDPAWLLGRQWQLGELNGEDAASPASVRIHVATSRLTRYRPGADPAVAAMPLAPDELLEPLVEAEPDEPADWRASAEAGTHFLALLAAANLRPLQDAYVDAFRLPDPAGLDAGLDPAEVRALRLFRRRSLDGAALRRAIREAATAAGEPVALPAEPSVPAAQRGRVLDVVRRWLAWYPAPHGGGSWQGERMEYAFAVAGPSPSGPGELVLEAPEYHGGRLDWPNLRVASGQTLGADADGTPERTLHTALPTPVTYPGMPANRWWEFEDARVWFGGVETEAGDLARMLLVEFATVYGNDWFIAPLDFDVGTLAHVEAVVVVDTFGQATVVRPTEVAPAAPGSTPWRMFRPADADPALFVVPPVVAHGVEGTSIEEVAFVRDEAANMAWAIERKVSGPVGNVVDRYERWRAALAASAPEPPAAEDLMRYRLATEVPDHWIPLVPQSEGLRSIRLDRGTVVSLGGRTSEARGRLLEPERELSLFEDELPRTGLAVTRAWQLARAANGTSVAWIGRQKRPGRGEASSGLAFDQLFPARPPAS